jgi:hypothetical protein
MTMSEGHGGGAEKQMVNVEVFAPRSPTAPKQFTWSKHLSVGEAADEAATAFGYQAGVATLAKDGVELDRSKQLVAAGVRDGDTLTLIDSGGGV